jgi:hypothetical protein
MHFTFTLVFRVKNEIKIGITKVAIQEQKSFTHVTIVRDDDENNFASLKITIRSDATVQLKVNWSTGQEY